MTNTRNHVVTIKFTSEELEMLRAGATNEGTTQSEYLRGCLFRDRLGGLDPIAMKIMRARLGCIFRGSDEELEAWTEFILGPARELKRRMEAERKGRRAKKK